MKNNKILIVYKRAEPEALALAKEAQSFLEAKGLRCEAEESPIKPASDQNPPGMAVVIGGDGTLIGLARKILPDKIPIFGINLGKLGFLTSSEKGRWREGLDAALSGKMPLRACLALKWEARASAGGALSGFAINEAVISRGALARLINLEVYINQFYMGILRCDGVIVCTPAGSSAYAVSAGGSLIHPGLAASCLVPICPFPVSVSPLVLPDSAEYEFKIIEPTLECGLTIDGQEGVKLAVGDIIKVTSFPSSLFIFRRESNFLEKLGKRGFSLPKGRL